MPKYHRSEPGTDQSKRRFGNADIQSLYVQADQPAADALAAIAQMDDSKRAKEARTALYLLAQRGLHPSIQHEPSPPLTVAAQQRGLLDTAAMSMRAPSCDRIIAFAQSIDSAPTTAILVDHFDTVTRVATTAETIHSLVSRAPVSKTEPIPFAAVVPVDYVRHRLSEAVETTRRGGALLPIGLTEALRRIGAPRQAYASHPAYDALGQPDPSWPGVSPENRIRRSTVATLVDVADQDAAARLVERVRSALSSPVLLTPAQSREMLERIYADAVPELFRQDLKVHVAQWLCDDALVWHYAGHPSSAVECLSLAEECSPDSAGLQRMLMDAARLIVALALVPDMQARRKEASSPIVTLDDLSDNQPEALVHDQPLIWRPGRP